jgi:hypothetical protein
MEAFTVAYGRKVIRGYTVMIRDTVGLNPEREE